MPATLSPPLARTYDVRILPIAFVILWSSGYIGGAFGVRYAEPFTMTSARFCVAALVFLSVALAIRAPWPRNWAAYGHAAVVGLLLQALQFGGLYTGIRHGVPAGEAALIVGLMPILVILAATYPGHCWASAASRWSLPTGWAMGMPITRPTWP